MSIDIEWSDPPSNGSKRPGVIDYDAVVAVLGGRPGEWAKVFEGNRGQATNVRTRLVRSGCRVVTRTLSEGVIGVWATFDGGKN